MKYFRLNSESYLVVGKKRAMLHNVIEQQSIWLNEKVSKLVKNSELGICIENPELQIFETLQKNNYGFITNSQIFIDKLRTINVFNEKKLHKKTPHITSTILQVTNSCDMSCEHCGKSFCPVCLKNPGKTLTLTEFKQIIDHLYNYSLRGITLSGGNLRFILI